MPDHHGADADVPDPAELPPEEVAARRRRLQVIVVVGLVAVVAWFGTGRLAHRAADRAAEQLRSELDAAALGVRPTDVGQGALDGSAPTPATPLLQRPEFRASDQPAPDEVRLVFRPMGWQAGLAPRCVVLVLRPTEHELLVRGRSCGLARPAEAPAP